MLNARQEVDHEIWWEMKHGTTNVWHENWTELGALYHLVPLDHHIDKELQKVAELRQGDGCNEQLIDQVFPEDIDDHIKQQMQFESNEGY